MSKDTQRLGKGLEALIPRSLFSSGRTIVSIPIGMIVPNRFQPRKTFADDAMRSLVASIKTYGLNQPILVRKQHDHYELIAGERRYRACIEAGLETISAIVKNVTDQESLQLALIENLERHDLNPMEIAFGYQRLIDEFSFTHQMISEFFCKSRSAVSNTLRLLNLPDVIQQMVEKGDISEGHARSLLSLSTDADMLFLAEKIKAESLNVRQIESVVSDLKKKPKETQAPIQLPLFETLERELGQKFSAKVSISGGENRGKITFHYQSSAHLEALLRVLSHMTDIP